MIIYILNVIAINTKSFTRDPCYLYKEICKNWRFKAAVANWWSVDHW